MSEAPESKAPFWSSLPGIITALGGLVVAVTGLITALFSMGVIGTNTNSNAVPPVAPAIALASVPSPSPAQDNERYKTLAGKWKVTETPPLDPHFAAVPSVTWDCDAAVTGNVLMLAGKILFVAHENDKPDPNERRIRSTLETKLTGLSGEGNYEFTRRAGFTTVDNSATIRFKDNLREFEAEVKSDDGKTHKLKGRKQL